MISSHWGNYTMAPYNVPLVGITVVAVVIEEGGKAAMHSDMVIRCNQLQSRIYSPWSRDDRMWRPPSSLSTGRIV